MPFAKASSTLRLRPLPVLVLVMISTHKVHLEHRSVSTLAGEELSMEYVELAEEEEDDEEDDVERMESTESSFVRLGGDIVIGGLSPRSQKGSFLVWGGDVMLSQRERRLLLLLRVYIFQTCVGIRLCDSSRHLGATGAVKRRFFENQDLG